VDLLEAYPWQHQAVEEHHGADRVPVSRAPGPARGPGAQPGREKSFSQSPAARATAQDPDQARRELLSGLTLAQAEELMIEDALERSGWVQKEAARRLGISQRALNYKIKKLGLTHPSWTVHRPEKD